MEFTLEDVNNLYKNIAMPSHLIITLESVIQTETGSITKELLDFKNLPVIRNTPKSLILNEKDFGKIEEKPSVDIISEYISTLRKERIEFESVCYASTNKTTFIVINCPKSNPLGWQEINCHESTHLPETSLFSYGIKPFTKSYHHFWVIGKKHRSSDDRDLRFADNLIKTWGKTFDYVPAEIVRVVAI